MHSIQDHVAADTGKARIGWQFFSKEIKSTNAMRARPKKCCCRSFKASAQSTIFCGRSSEAFVKMHRRYCVSGRASVKKTKSHKTPVNQIKKNKAPVKTPVKTPVKHMDLV